MRIVRTASIGRLAQAAGLTQRWRPTTAANSSPPRSYLLRIIQMQLGITVSLTHTPEQPALSHRLPEVLPMMEEGYT
jgi:hypothetical protein